MSGKSGLNVTARSEQSLHSSSDIVVNNSDKVAPF